MQSLRYAFDNEKPPLSREKDTDIDVRYLVGNDIERKIPNYLRSAKAIDRIGVTELLTLSDLNMKELQYLIISCAIYFGTLAKSAFPVQKRPLSLEEKAILEECLSELAEFPNSQSAIIENVNKVIHSWMRRFPELEIRFVSEELIKPEKDESDFKSNMRHIAISLLIVGRRKDVKGLNEFLYFLSEERLAERFAKLTAGQIIYRRGYLPLAITFIAGTVVSQYVNIAQSIRFLFEGLIPRANAQSGAADHKVFIPPLGISDELWRILILILFILFLVIICLMTYAGYFAKRKNMRAATIIEHFVSFLLGALLGSSKG